MQFRLSAPELDLSVDVRLRSFGERWIAVAEIAGDRELGLGATAREALTAALASLGEAASVALLADPALFGPSSAVVAAEAGRRPTG